jgi:SAM-dependent methyltransferase
MGADVFDQVARDYERIHNRSLPPGVRSDEFVVQKAVQLVAWIGAAYRGRELRYLDFGCGNGRLFRQLLESPGLRPLFDRGHLRLFGFDTSVESLREAEAIAGAGNVCLADDFARFPRGVRFDFVISCNVFHHIPPDVRHAAVDRLADWAAPGAHLVIWEHNPLNPFARLIVRICPFDREARLLSLPAARRLFGRRFDYRRHAFVNVFPPGLQRVGTLRRIEARLARVPVGAQYWVMFEAA